MIIDTTKIHDALLRTADHLDYNPEKFDYWVARVPADANQVGCYLAHLGLALGFEPGTNSLLVTAKTGVSESSIFRKWAGPNFNWRISGLNEVPKPEVAKTLRRMAEEDFSDEVLE